MGSQKAGQGTPGDCHLSEQRKPWFYGKVCTFATPVGDPKEEPEMGSTRGAVPPDLDPINKSCLLSNFEGKLGVRIDTAAGRRGLGEDGSLLN